jgi:hypothetical protein
MNECRAAFTERNTHSTFSFLFLKKEQGNSTGARWFLGCFFIAKACFCSNGAFKTRATIRCDESARWSGNAKRGGRRFVVFLRKEIHGDTDDVTCKRIPGKENRRFSTVRRGPGRPDSNRGPHQRSNLLDSRDDARGPGALTGVREASDPSLSVDAGLANADTIAPRLERRGGYGHYGHHRPHHQHGHHHGHHRHSAYPMHTMHGGFLHRRSDEADLGQKSVRIGGRGTQPRLERRAPNTRFVIPGSWGPQVNPIMPITPTMPGMWNGSPMANHGGGSSYGEHHHHHHDHYD